MSFYKNIDNNNYLMITKKDLYLLINTGKKKELEDEVIRIIRAIKQFSRNYSYISFNEIALHKDNIIAQFLLTENKKIKNEDLEINTLKSFNALCISILENNPKFYIVYEDGKCVEKKLCKKKKLT